MCGTLRLEFEGGSPSYYFSLRLLAVPISLFLLYLLKKSLNGRIIPYVIDNQHVTDKQYFIGNRNIDPDFRVMILRNAIRG